ncbi:type VI secretion system-associated FHA domain protein TagH [Paracidovorax anthurii]|uniref:FHA domain protein n=1 Tax=Paracidovorax anthurii TaxID=78229 RepID=A0A328ZH94_9BURK|nr:type VI secretion system-associated FHA domain protein TagH [Paracidovorax anthurii]RAR85281.1 FHA domain protein [Paracidovorax anthurii]
MDKVELRVTRQAGGHVDRLWTAVFGVAGGTIGRGGQNKLVLPDGDAGVARVHAMVRIESEAAYIANLCERRSIFVAGGEVRSGEEVRLSVGDEVQVGPYTLRSVIPGSPYVAEVSAPAPAEPAQPPAPEAVVAEEAFVPPPSVPAPSHVAVLAMADEPENPFAMLGRVPAADAGTPATQLPRETGLSGPVPEVPSETGPAHAGAFPSPMPGEGAAVARGNMPSPPPPVPEKPVTSRPLVIPDDFDLFAVDTRRVEEKKDVWAGGLQSKSLSEVANLRHDDLLQSLPTGSTKFTEDMDNPAHTGLPKGLDPRPELDPLRLFDGSSAPSLLPSGSEHASIALGSDLSQSFSLPKGLSEGAGQRPGTETRTGPALPVGATPAPGDEAAPRNMQTLTVGGAAASVTPSPVAPPVAAPNVPLTGLQRVDGLDLGSFGASSLSGGDLDWSRPEASASSSGQVEVPALAHPVIRGDVGILGAEPQSTLPEGYSASKPEDIPQAPMPRQAVDQKSILAEQSSASPLAPVLPDLESASPAELQSLITAFLEGAGVLPKKVEPQKLSPEFMRSFGEAFQVAVQGTIDLLAARSEIKREFRAGVTIIASGANNPLKFLPTPEGVIMQMIGQSFPGFMKPIPAMQEAYEDLRVHQVALMAGLRAAYAEALARFDPAELEGRTDVTGGVFGKLSATSRKAALWDEYKKNFAEIRRGAEDDLAAFSGQAFLEAYENAEAAAKART